MQSTWILRTEVLLSANSSIGEPIFYGCCCGGRVRMETLWVWVDAKK